MNNLDEDTRDELVPKDKFIEQSQTAAEALVKAQISARYIMAAKSPRDIETVRHRMLKECKRPSFCMPDEKKNGSSVAIYRIPRGGSKIEGVTIRFAEMSMRAYGNLGIDVQPLGEDATQRIYLLTCTDYETNNVTTEIVNVPKTIERSFAKDTDTVISQRTNSYGKPVYTIIGTDDDLAMKKNALGSKARRNLILQHIPGWLVEECIEQIQDTAAKKDAEDPDAAKRKLFDAFAGVGVTPVMLNDFLGHANQLTPAELEDLRGYFGALREGYTTWAEIVATKGDSQDADVTKHVEEALAKSGRNPAQSRKLKSQYVGRAGELLTFLKDEAKKKADTGTQSVEESRADQVKPKQQAAPETKIPPEVKEAAAQQVAVQANHSTPSEAPTDWD